MHVVLHFREFRKQGQNFLLAIRDGQFSELIMVNSVKRFNS